MIHLPRSTGEVVVPLAVTLRTLACVMHPAAEAVGRQLHLARMAIPDTPAMP